MKIGCSTYFEIRDENAKHILSGTDKIGWKFGKQDKKGKGECGKARIMSRISNYKRKNKSPKSIVSVFNKKIQFTLYHFFV